MADNPRSGLRQMQDLLQRPIQRAGSGKGSRGRPLSTSLRPEHRRAGGGDGAGRGRPPRQAVTIAPERHPSAAGVPGDRCTTASALPIMAWGSRRPGDLTEQDYPQVA
jgi:hypothetical protein